MAEDSALENLRQDIRERSETDKVLPIFWILLPLVGVGVAIITGIIASVLAISSASIDFDFEPGVGFVPGPGFGPGSFGTFFPGVFSIVAIGFLGGLISTLLYVYLFYLLINRRNKHFARQSRFSEDLINYVKSVSDRKKGVDIQTGVSSLERSARDVRKVLMKYSKTELKPEEFTDKTSLLTELNINSARIVDIILDFEDTFGIQIDDADADMVNTIGDNISLISRKLES